MKGIILTTFTLNKKTIRYIYSVAKLKAQSLFSATEERAAFEF